MMNYQVNQNVPEKAFSLNFLSANPEVDFDSSWLWSPKNSLNETTIQTATFSGKNQADDYTNE